MPIICIPTRLRELTDGNAQVTVPGVTVGSALDHLEATYPALRGHLREGDEIGPHLAVVVNGELSRLRMHHPLTEQCEVYFVPAAHGGS